MRVVRRSQSDSFANVLTAIAIRCGVADAERSGHPDPDSLGFSIRASTDSNRGADPDQDPNHHRGALRDRDPNRHRGADPDQEPNHHRGADPDQEPNHHRGADPDQDPNDN